MSFRILLVLACLWFAAAQTRVLPFAYTQEDLPNGLRLVTLPTDTPNVVSIYIVVQTGSRNEVEPGKSGFAHLFEHIMFRGTEKYPADRFRAVMQGTGAQSNASTSTDLTQYYATFSKEDLGQILTMEADRFQNLKYAVEAFKTETGAVLGEFNKNSADPSEKLDEVLNNTAFDRHTYKHTTMGFLADVQDMPNQFDYSLKFFDRYYRPEYTTIVVSGDVDAKNVRKLVDASWGNWKKGTYHPDVPAELPQKGAREQHVDWPSPTLPLLSVAYKSPAYSDTDKDFAALDALAAYAFSPNSELYQKLVVQEQKVDQLSGSIPRRVDPYLFGVDVRLKKPEDMDYVRGQILATIEKLQKDLIPAKSLETIKSRTRYQFALQMDNAQAVASTVARFVALKRTPGTIDKYFSLYAKLTPEDLRAAARKYLIADSRTIVTLTGAKK